jgi:hypothetical protein
MGNCFPYGGTGISQIATNLIVARLDISGDSQEPAWVTRVTGDPGAAFSACKIKTRAFVASGWQTKLARVSRMDWEEIRLRLRQEFNKQSDLVRYELGVRPGAIRLDTRSTAQPGQFFFSGGEGSERAELLRQHLPDEAAAILREADEICGHRFRLLGYDKSQLHS